MHWLFRHVQFLLTVRAMSKRRLFRAADLEAFLLQYQIYLPIVPYPYQKTSNNSQGKYTSKHGHRNVHLVMLVWVEARSVSG